MITSPKTSKTRSFPSPCTRKKHPISQGLLVLSRDMMSRTLLLTLLTFFSASCSLAAPSPNTTAPTVTVLNGTLQGVHSSTWNQDFFLGIPYAQPPLGNLRFRWPQSLNTSYDGVRDASQYGYSCYQYNSNFNLSEDCLTLNVVKPVVKTKKEKLLPVIVWFVKRVSNVQV